MGLLCLKSFRDSPSPPVQDPHQGVAKTTLASSPCSSKPPWMTLFHTSVPLYMLFPPPYPYSPLLPISRFPSDHSLDSLPLGSLLCPPPQDQDRCHIYIFPLHPIYIPLIRSTYYNCLITPLSLQQNHMCSESRIIFCLLLVVSMVPSVVSRTW